MTTIDLNISVRVDDFTLRAAVTTDAPVLGVFGPSGAGKTTLLHAIAGLIRPDEGHIRLGDRALTNVAKGTHVPTHERRIGLVFQDGRLFPHCSVEKNLRYGQRCARGRDSALGFDELVDLLAIRPLLNRSPRSLSGGEQQRVALGRALLSAPDLVLMDEPLAALDQTLKRQILPYLRAVVRRTGLPMVYISHDLTEILALTDQLLVLDQGKTIGAGAWKDLTRDSDVLSRVMRSGLYNVHEMTVVDPDDGGCTRLRSSDGTSTLELLSGRVETERGRRMIVTTRPEDIAIAMEPVAATSIRNQFEATVTGAVPVDGRVIVELDAGERLLVEISTGSWTKLGLAEGSRVWCLLKANAVGVEPFLHERDAAVTPR